MIAKNEQLKEWAKKALSYYNEKAPEIDRCFYFFQKPADFSKECDILIVGLNPGGSFSFSDQYKKKEWGFQTDGNKHIMPMNVFTGGNQYWNERRSWKIYQGMTSIGLGKTLESDNCQYVNYIPLNSNNFNEYLTKDKSVGTYDQCVKLFQEYVEILQPRTIIVLGTTSGMDKMNCGDQDILVGGRKRFLIKGNIKGIPAYAIPHPSYSNGWGADAKVVMTDYIAKIIAGEGDTLKPVNITSNNSVANTIEFSEITEKILGEAKPKGTYRIELNAELSLTLTSSERGYFGVRPTDYDNYSHNEKEQMYLKYKSVMDELNLESFRKANNLIWFGRCYFKKFSSIEDIVYFINELKQKISAIC